MKANNPYNKCIWVTGGVLGVVLPLAVLVFAAVGAGLFSEEYHTRVNNAKKLDLAKAQIREAQAQREKYAEVASIFSQINYSNIRANLRQVTDTLPNTGLGMDVLTLKQSFTNDAPLKDSPAFTPELVNLTYQTRFDYLLKATAVLETSCPQLLLIYLKLEPGAATEPNLPRSELPLSATANYAVVKLPTLEPPTP